MKPFPLQDYVSIYTYRNEYFIYKVDFFMFLFLFELRLYADGAVNLLLRFGTQMPVCQQYIAGYTVAIF